MTTALLLAAGSSRRFGSECKLQALYRGKPLVRHAADAILQTGLPAVAVTADPKVDALLPEFRIIRSIGNQSRSLQAGIAGTDDETVLIVLGDMPHVSAVLLQQIAAAPPPAAATDGTRITPPARIPRSMFADVLALSGDRGAMALLRSRRDLQLVSANSQMLMDIDTKTDLFINY